jgi:peptide deformylase
MPYGVGVAATPQGRRFTDIFTHSEAIESGGEEAAEEGCLSIPDFREEVRRPRHVLLRGLDRTGRPIEIEGEGLLARIFQHEMDHLNGLFFVDRLSPAKRLLLLPKLKKAFRHR